MACHAQRLCRHFCGSPIRVNKRSSPFAAFLSSDVLLAFCCGPLFSRWEHCAPLQTHPQNMTCMFAHMHAQISVWRMHVSVAAHPRPYRLFLIATAAVSQEINTCNIHGNTIVWLNKHWRGRETEWKKLIGRLIPVAHIISVYCVLRRQNDPRLYISAHNACRVSRTSQIPPIMDGWGGGGRLRDCK